MTGAATPVDGIAIDATTEIVSTPTVDAVLEALTPPPKPEAPWSYTDPIFWATVFDIGEPKMRHAIDMVLVRGPHTRTITMFDAVIDDGRGKHR